MVSDPEGHFPRKLENNNAVLSVMLDFVGAARNVSKLFAWNVTALRDSIQGNICKLYARVFL